MKHKIFGCVFIVITFIAMLTALIVRGNYVFSTQKFYTEEQLSQNYKKGVDDGYDKGEIDFSDENLIERVNNLIIENLEIKQKNEELIADNSSKSEIIENNNQTINELTNQINDLQNNDVHAVFVNGNELVKIYNCCKGSTIDYDLNFKIGKEITDDSGTSYKGINYFWAVYNTETTFYEKIDISSFVINEDTVIYYTCEGFVEPKPSI